MSEPTSIAFVCVQNAGRSQMAYAFAERERAERGLTGQIELLTGGTDPADHVHDIIVDVMADVGFDLADRTPQAITPEALESVDIVITMGCDAGEVCPVTWRGDSRDWDLQDPHGQPRGTVTEIRDEIETRVQALFDELSAPREV